MDTKDQERIKKEFNLKKNGYTGLEITKLSQKASEEGRSIVAGVLAVLAPIFAVGEPALYALIDVCGEDILAISEAAKNTMLDVVKEIEIKKGN